MKRFSVFVLLLVVTFSVIHLKKVEAAGFPDVKAYQDEINYLVDRDIIRGNPDGTFKPEKTLNRLNAIQINFIKSERD